MIREIEKLNKEIDRIMTEKTKADAQKEVWANRLTESLKSYYKEYGVDLSGKDLTEIKKKLVAETNLIEAKTKEEFERSAQIVNLINNGDIKGAWQVLGGGEDAELDNEVEEIQEVKPQPSATPEIQGAIEAVEEMGDDDFYGEGFDDEDEYIESNQPVNLTPVTPKVSTTANIQKPVQETKKVNSFTSFIMEDDDDEDEFVIPSTGSGSPKASTSSKPSGGFVMEDEDDDDFGGFGNILAGSKFKV